jgi:hypothetical protein
MARLANVIQKIFIISLRLMQLLLILICAVIPFFILGQLAKTGAKS